MSPRAACRLERIGFVQVHDYTAGISDWKAAGLYVEATERQVVSVADAMQVDVPTCDPMETLGPVRNRTFAAGWEENIVLDCDVCPGQRHAQTGSMKSGDGAKWTP